MCDLLIFLQGGTVGFALGDTVGAGGAPFARAAFMRRPIHAPFAAGGARGGLGRGRGPAAGRVADKAARGRQRDERLAGRIGRASAPTPGAMQMYV